MLSLRLYVIACSLLAAHGLVQAAPASLKFTLGNAQSCQMAGNLKVCVQDDGAYDYTLSVSQSDKPILQADGEGMLGGKPYQPAGSSHSLSCRSELTTVDGEETEVRRLCQLSQAGQPVADITIDNPPPVAL